MSYDDPQTKIRSAPARVEDRGQHAAVERSAAGASPTAHCDLICDGWDVAEMHRLGPGCPGPQRDQGSTQPVFSVQVHEVPGIDVLHLVDPPGVLLAALALAEPLRRHPHANDLERDRRADDLAADAQHVGVRMRAS